VERKSKDDPIFHERKVKSNAIDYRLPIDSSNLGYATARGISSALLDSGTRVSAEKFPEGRQRKKTRPENSTIRTPSTLSMPYEIAGGH